MLYLAFAGQACPKMGRKSVFYIDADQCPLEGSGCLFRSDFPLLLLGFFVGWTHIRIDNWLWIAFYSGALLVLSCRRWWVRLLGVGLNLLSLWALTLIVSMGSGQAWLELLWRSVLPFVPVTIL